MTLLARISSNLPDRQRATKFFKIAVRIFFFAHDFQVFFLFIFSSEVSEGHTVSLFRVETTRNRHQANPTWTTNFFSVRNVFRVIS
jgi:hypothetical protein